MSYTRTWYDQTGDYGRVVKGRTKSGDPYNNITPLRSSLVQTRTGESVPDWREKIARGEFAASPYSTSRQQLLLQPAYMVAGQDIDKSWWNTTEFQGFNSFPVPNWSVPDFPTSVANKALANILSKVRHEYEHVNLVPDIAEIGQTVRMFGAPASAILSLTDRHVNRLELAARGLHGSTVFKRIAWGRIVAASYLEYAFGLKPLIRATAEVAEALARWKGEADGDLPRPVNQRLRSGSKSNEASDSYTTSSVEWSGTIGFKTQLIKKIEYGVKYDVTLNHSVQADYGSNERLLQLLGFNPTTFIPTLWEVLPWSWLVDYFLNVQQIIEAGLTVTSNVERIMRMQKISELYTITEKAYLAAARTSWVFAPSAPGSGQFRRTTFTRTLPASLGVPTLEVSYPNSITKLANATAALFARRAHANALWLF